MNRVLIKFSLQRRKIGGRLGKIFRVPKKKTRPLKKKSTSAAVNEDSGLAGIVSSHGPSVLGHGNFEELVNLKIIIKRLIRLYLEPLDLGQRAVNSGSAGIVSSHGPSFVGHGKFEEFVNLNQKTNSSLFRAIRLRPASSRFRRIVIGNKVRWL